MKDGFFNPEYLQQYEQIVAAVIPCYHQLPTIAASVLAGELKASGAHCLITGVGTGSELVYFLNNFEHLVATAQDIEPTLIAMASHQCKKNHIADRVKFFEGAVSVLDEGEVFDVATAVLVMHFMPREEKLIFLKSIVSRLKPSGKFFLADIGNIDNHLFYDAWLEFMTLSQLSKSDINTEIHLYNDELYLLSKQETMDLLVEAGFDKINLAFQGLHAIGIVAEKK